jgi:xylitol oxidase
MPDSDVGENWAGTHRYRAQAVVAVHSVDQISSLVQARSNIKAIGTRHSFNDIADSTGILVTVADLGGEPTIDEDRQRVTVPAGMSYGILGRFLEAHGWALHNLGSLPHISVAGACATGTHGSGAENQSLAAAVCGIELVTGTGQLVRIDDNDPQFLGCVVALGALGIVTSLTLRIEPSFAVRQDVYVDVPWSELQELDSMMSSAYSVSLFTHWRGVVDQVWSKSKSENDTTTPRLPSSKALPARGPLSPTGTDHANTTVQGGVPGSWNERLPHFKFDGSPSHGEEIQSEYLVPREHGLAALQSLETISDTFSPHLIISELRYVAADDLWLSPAYQRDSLAIHFTWKKEPEMVRTLLPPIERALKPFGARAHWGKWFSTNEFDISMLYPRLTNFIALARQYDPEGKFNNGYLNRVLGPGWR